ncbi:MAG: glucosamine-6-phosphate deaminase [Acidobacteriota bacterium]
MIIRVFEDKFALGAAAAAMAREALCQAIAEKGQARIIAATGASQFEFLDALTASSGIDWPKVEMFHLDEYVGISADHPASFRKYLMERLIQKTGIQNYHLLNGETDPVKAAASVGKDLNSAPIDVAFVGIGENGHLAFNDPPADFDTTEPYLIVQLDQACRMQQVGEGWFSSLQEVPTQAISMSVRQILKAKKILCVVPDARKAKAVKATVESEISPTIPASILRKHPDTVLFLDRDSASLLAPETLSQYRNMD